MELHMSWASDELFNIDLGDERLNKRSVKILDALGGNPVNSIPAACNGYHETKAAYRFFDNAGVTPKKILKPHIDATLKRIAEEKIVLCVQDTTELDFSGQKVNHHLTAEEKKLDKKLPIEEKESYRWLLSYQAACNIAEKFPDKTIVSVGDREC